MTPEKTLEELQADLEAKAAALVDLCNKSSLYCTANEVMAVEAALERLYRLRKGQAEQSAPVQEPYKGWYCANCQRGVDASEVTYHEQHTVCGRTITDDAPPAAQPAVPEGWKLVPIKPTMQMINALADTDPEHESVWGAVLAAAPKKSSTP